MQGSALRPQGGYASLTSGRDGILDQSRGLGPLAPVRDQRQNAVVSAGPC